MTSEFRRFFFFGPQNTCIMKRSSSLQLCLQWCFNPCPHSISCITSPRTEGKANFALMHIHNTSKDASGFPFKVNAKTSQCCSMQFCRISLQALKVPIICGRPLIFFISPNVSWRVDLLSTSFYCKMFQVHFKSWIIHNNRLTFSMHFYWPRGSW